MIFVQKSGNRFGEFERRFIQQAVAAGGEDLGFGGTEGFRHAVGEKGVFRISLAGEKEGVAGISGQFIPERGQNTRAPFLQNLGQCCGVLCAAGGEEFGGVVFLW